MSEAGTVTMASEAEPKQGMTPREIKAELILRGITLKAIADAAGVTRGAVTQTIHQYHNNSYKGYRVRKYIAQALERPVDDIWPNAR